MIILLRKLKLFLVRDLEVFILYKNIIFIPQNKITKRDYKRFGFATFIKRGYNIKYWDLTPYLRPYYHKNYIIDKSNIFNTKYQFSKIKEINKAFESLTKKDLIISLLPADNPNSFIYKKIKELNLNLCLINLTDHPENSNSRLNRKLLWAKLFETLRKDPLNLLKKLSKKLFLHSTLPNAKYVIISGKNTFTNAKKLFKSAKIIKTHSLDYDEYLDIEDSKIINNNNKKFAVFVDSNLAYDMDSSWGNEKPIKRCSPQEYFKEMNNFFDIFKKKTGLEIIIAAHPRSNYETKALSYKSNIKIIKNKTPQLIKNSEIVILHQSTSINFAIMYKKPVLFLNSELFDKNLRVRIDFLSNFFKSNALNISRNYSINKVAAIDHSFYKYYKEEYIKMNDSHELKIWDIFCDNI